MRYALFLALCCLTACQAGPSHIPPVHQIPGAAIGSAIENTRYASRRSKVKASIAPHLDFILADADSGGGSTMNMSCKLARVSSPKCAELAKEIAQDAHIYKVGSVDERVEKLTVAFMVYGD